MWPNLFKRRRYKIVRIWKDGDFYVLVRDGWFKPWRFLSCAHDRKMARQCIKFHKRMGKK
jgi:hypothetical protein